MDAKLIEELRQKYSKNPPEGMTSNLVKNMTDSDLLDMLGYDKEIVEDARNAAFNFENKGIWDAL